jgi:hypothetical protein
LRKRSGPGPLCEQAADCVDRRHRVRPRSVGALERLGPDRQVHGKARHDARRSIWPLLWWGRGSTVLPRRFQVQGRHRCARRTTRQRHSSRDQSAVHVPFKRPQHESDPEGGQIGADIRSIYDRLPPDGRAFIEIRGANHFLLATTEPC